MIERYLDMSYCNGKPYSAYLYLQKRVKNKVSNSKPVDDLFILDFDENEKPFGVEILDLQAVTLDKINKILVDLNVEEMTEDEFTPLKRCL